MGEGDRSAEMAVVLDAASTQTVTVDYATGGGTASPGSDYVSSSGTLTYPPGVTVRNITIGIVDDTLQEGDEELVLTLSNPRRAALDGRHNRAVLTIVDDDWMAYLPIVTRK